MITEFPALFICSHLEQLKGTSVIIKKAVSKKHVRVLIVNVWGGGLAHLSAIENSVIFMQFYLIIQI